MEGNFPLVAIAQCPPKQMNPGLFEDEAGQVHYGNIQGDPSGVIFIVTFRSHHQIRE